MAHVQTWRILHIDDDEDDYVLTRAMLNQAQGRKISLEWASTLEDGRRKLSGNHYHAVLVDYDLGAHTGIELIREMVEKGYGAPLILFTGRGSYDVDVEAMHAGATVYLTKGEVTPLQLERSIRYAIERKQVEKELVERDRKLRLALEAARLGAWTYHFSDRVLEMDARAQQLYCAPQPVMDHDELVRTVLHPDDDQPMREHLDRASSPTGDGRYQIEYRIVQPDGSVRWVQAWGLAQFEGSGAERQAVSISGVSRDVTLEKQAAEALRASEERYSQLFNNDHTPMLLIDPETEQICSANAAACAFYGWSQEELTRKRITEINILPPDQVRGEMWRAHESKSSQVFFFNHRLSNGEVRDVEVHSGPIRTGDKVFLYSIILDITERKQAEARRRQSEQRLDWALAVSHGGVWDWDLRTGAAWWSPEMYMLWGVEPGTPMDTENSLALVDERDRSAVRAALDEAIASRQDANYTFRIRHASLGERWMESFVRPIYSPDGQATYMTGLTFDITARKLAEDALRESEQRYRQLAGQLPAKQAAQKREAQPKDW